MYGPVVWSLLIAKALSRLATGSSSADLARPNYYENGVDLSLVRYSLSLTPTQRLKAVENFMNVVASVRTLPLPLADSAK